jgi:hypothetical protein
MIGHSSETAARRQSDFRRASRKSKQGLTEKVDIFYKCVNNTGCMHECRVDEGGTFRSNHPKSD